MDLIADPGNAVFVSAASSYEIVLKNRQGKWPAVDLIAMNVATVIREEGFQELPLTSAHMQLAASLSLDHKDPFDRMLSAQSLLDELPIISADPKLDVFNVSRIF